MTSSGDLNAWFQAKVNAITREMKVGVEEASERGANITEHFIETRGTAKSGKRGRIDTRDMINSVGSEKVSETPTTLQTRFGYIKNRVDYTKFQELGFDHVGGSTVEGMYALSDAAEEVRAELYSDLRSRLNGI